MKFSEWLQRELKQSDMDQSNLARRAEMGAYPVARNSVSRIGSVCATRGLIPLSRLPTG